MSGHSKWSQIKHKKSKEDAKRGRIFTKLIREIIVAARMGGGNPEANARLRAAIAAAKAVNMPKENIERAIKKGTGELEGEVLEEYVLEGYGPGGVAVMVRGTTDNRNRTIAELRRIFSKHGGSLGETGCVSWLFERKGVFVFSKKDVDEDRLFEKALEFGADDIKDMEEDGTFEVYTDPLRFEEIKRKFDEEGIKYTFCEISMIPQTTVRLEGKEAEQMIKLMNALEECDDIQDVYANFNIASDVLEAMAG